VSGPPTLPIFVICTEETDPDVRCRDTLLAAEGSMESYEVEKGFYSVFDSEGRPARLAVEKWQVRIVGWDEPSPERLRGLLEAYLSRDGATPSGLSLAGLVDSAARVAPEREQARLRPRWLARRIAARGKRSS
jgi:hypothetical protein